MSSQTSKQAPFKCAHCQLWFNAHNLQRHTLSLAPVSGVNSSAAKGTKPLTAFFKSAPKTDGPDTTEKGSELLPKSRDGIAGSATRSTTESSDTTTESISVPGTRCRGVSIRGHFPSPFVKHYTFSSHDDASLTYSVSTDGMARSYCCSMLAQPLSTSCKYCEDILYSSAFRSIAKRALLPSTDSTILHSHAKCESMLCPNPIPCFYNHNMCPCVFR